MISTSNSSVSVTFNILSKKTKCTLELDGSITIGRIKQELQQDFQIPPSRTKIINSGKILADDVVLSSLKRKNIVFLVMGSKPSSELSQLVVEDCIAASLGFLTLEEIQNCRLVSRSWNVMCLKGSVKNRDRYTFSSDGKTCFDLLQNKTAYVLSEPIQSIYEMTSIHSSYIHDYFNVYTVSGAVKKRVYTGTEMVFIVNTNGIAETSDVFQAIDVPTGSVILRFSEHTFNEIKPIDVKMKQERAFTTFRRELLLKKDKERRDRLKQEFNEQMKLQKTAVNSVEWQQRLILLQNEANDTRKFEESSEFQNLVESERKKFFADTLIFAFYDHSTKNIILEFGNYIVSIDPKTGNCKNHVTLVSTTQKEEIIEEAVTPILPLEKFYILKTQSNNVMLLDRQTLKIVFVMKDIGTDIRNFICPIKTEDELYILAESSNGAYSLWTTTGKNVMDFTTESLHVTHHNIFAGSSVFDIDELKQTFAGFDRDRNQLASGTPLVIYEDKEFSLGGFIHLSKFGKIEKQNAFGAVEELRRCSCFKSVAVNVEYERHFRAQEKVVEAKLVPSIQWAVPIGVPWSLQASMPRSFYLYGDYLYFVCAIPSGKRKGSTTSEETNDDEEEQADENDRSEENDEDDEELDTSHHQHEKYLLYCLDIKAGTMVWKDERFSAVNSKTMSIEVFPRANSLFTFFHTTAGTVLMIHILNTGTLTFRTTQSSNDDQMSLDHKQLILS
ncbi:hypothetical protein C9374_000275 [Naegleria lovaniensis]|uniref:Ubiquitin-like domain-containing protein n=1 Tax=Naegleria lovaniensis TaxID=51637 RepID=A0AA88GZF9_NAELO|nr:uncharacterized protein C9374_000275 [Naegleria lovaniensis]KAG2388836.1 hypothetical protein C9374_000275 [Naegleria lovaniensis]